MMCVMKGKGIMDEKFNGYPIEEDVEKDNIQDDVENSEEDTIAFDESDNPLQEETSDDVNITSGGDEYIPGWVQENTEESEQTSFGDERFETPSKKKNGAVAAIVTIVVILVVAAIVAAGYFIIKGRNPYNQLGYVNVSGRTIKDVSDEMGFASVADFLKEYSLPEDMPEDTEEAAAFYSMPVSVICDMNGVTFDMLKELYEFNDDITESTPWGIAQGSVKISKLVMEEDFEQFKAENGLGDDITLDTPWGEVRNIVEQKALEMMKKEEEEAKKRADESEAVVDDEAVEDVANDAAIDDVETETAETEIGEESEAVAE